MLLHCLLEQFVISDHSFVFSSAHTESFRMNPKRREEKKKKTRKKKGEEEEEEKRKGEFNLVILTVSSCCLI